MKYTVNILFLCYFSAVIHAQNNTDSIKADVLLDSAFLKQSAINVKFINSIEYTSDGFILLSSSKQFFLLGIGGIVPMFESWNGVTGIESFAVRADGVLMAVSGNTLYQAHSDPSFIKVMEIPDSDMGISSKYKNIYVFDRKVKGDKKDYSIYQISENKEIAPFVTISTPILSVFEQSSLLVFSTKSSLFVVDIKTKKSYKILTLPQEDDIISVVGDTINHAFYFSTKSAIYRIKENKIEIISKDFGGILRYDGKGLVIFNSEKQLIIRLRNNLLYSTTDKKEVVPAKDETDTEMDWK